MFSTVVVVVDGFNCPMSGSVPGGKVGKVR